MKILHLTAPAPFGGLERVVAGLARESVARGHDVILQMTLSPREGVPRWASDLSAHGVTLRPTRVSPRSYLAERRAVRELIERDGVQVVHSHGYRSDFLHLGVAHRAGVPIVSTAHGFASKNPGYGRYERLQIWAWKRFDAVVAVSEALERQLIGFGVPRGRLVHIRNGVIRGADPLLRSLARERLGLAAVGAVIGWVGRFSEEKAPLLAVEAFASVVASGATLCMIGAGPLESASRQRAAELGIVERVVFAGAQPDAAPLLSAFDALLLSSHTEGTPMVILEAAMAGVPIISTAVGGVPDIVGTDALTVPARDATALARAMDATLRDGDAARQRAERLRTRLNASAAADDWVGQYLTLYDRVRRQKPSQQQKKSPA